MGRRALKPIARDLDLSSWLLTFDDLPLPWSTAELFGRAAPLEVEVGSGKGLFMSRAAETAPERNFLGVEVAGKYARAAAARLAKADLSAGKILHGDALRLFRERLPDRSVEAVHVYFPDPWWKARHRKRRVMNEPFLRDVQRVLLPDGRLHFWTDVEEYFQTSLELIARATSLTGPMEVPERPAAHTLDYRTHFERRMRLHDQPVYRAEFQLTQEQFPKKH